MKNVSINDTRQISERWWAALRLPLPCFSAKFIVLPNFRSSEPNEQFENFGWNDQPINSRLIVHPQISRESQLEIALKFNVELRQKCLIINFKKRNIHVADVPYNWVLLASAWSNRKRLIKLDSNLLECSEPEFLVASSWPSCRGTRDSRGEFQLTTSSWNMKWNRFSWWHELDIKLIIMASTQ